MLDFAECLCQKMKEEGRRKYCALELMGKRNTKAGNVLELGGCCPREGRRKEEGTNKQNLPEVTILPNDLGREELEPGCATTAKELS